MPDRTVVRINGLTIFGHGVTFSVRNVPAEEVEAVKKVMEVWVSHGESFALEFEHDLIQKMENDQ
jgi:hypothetical protein